jgi:hypothetical protein
MLQAAVRITPPTRARITGAVYLFFFLTAILGEVFLRQAGVSWIRPTPADASAAASGILAHEVAYRAGIALALISTANPPS